MLLTLLCLVAACAPMVGEPGAATRIEAADSGLTTPAQATGEHLAATGQNQARDLPPLQRWVCPQEPLSPRYEPTLYVSEDGDDDNDGRSESGALATLQRAADLAEAGDVVWVKEGVYSSDVVFSGTGTAGEPIVFESYPGECAVLDGSQNVRSRHTRFDGARHYVFRNFIVRNSPVQGIYLIDSENIHISHVRSHHNGLSGIQNVEGKNNRFTHFMVHDNSDGRGGNADGIGISSGTGMHIEHCLAFRNSDDGVDAWKSKGTVIARCIAFENGFQGGDGNGFKAGGGLPDGNAVVRYNIAFGNKSNGFTYNSGGGIRFEHNTSFDNGGAGFVAGGVTLRNNLAFSNSRDELYDDGGGNDEANNSWNIGLSEPPFGSTELASAQFLALDATAQARGGRSAGSRSVGALAPGETIRTAFGIDLGQLLQRVGSE